MRTLGGQGYGGLLLEDFNKRLNKIILLEIDPITDEISSKRLKFYKNAASSKTVTTISIPLTETTIEGMR